MAGRTGVYIPQEKIVMERMEARWVRTWKYPVYSANGDPRYLIGVSQDITETVLAQEEADYHAHEVDVLRDRVTQAAKFAAIGELAGGVAHEINTPLGVILLAADQLDKELKNAEPKAKRNVQMILETAERISTIVQTMKALSRPDQSAPHQLSALKSILDDVLNISRYKLRNLSVKVFLDSSLDQINIYCNQTQIAQVFVNLINNSCDAISDLPSKWIRISVGEDAEHFKIIFSDSGAGIDPKIAERLFSGSFTSKANSGGSGLGLLITKSIVESHGGTVEIDKNAENTTFVISLLKEKIEKFDA